MKKLFIFATIIASACSSFTAHADPFTGFYKIAVVINGVSTYDDYPGEYYTYDDGANGRVKVYINTNGNLRVSGWAFNPDTGLREALRGRVNPTTGRVILTRIDNDIINLDVFPHVIKIIKRNNTVIGLNGTGEDYGLWDDGYYSGTYQDQYDITGYKIRELP
ncbi:MAG: hypothetical protein ACPIA7_09740 [Akkermansiaceae bacterium]